MNKNELITELAQRTGLTQGQATKAVNEFVRIVSDALLQGDEVKLVGFGTWKVVKREERKGRNPQTGEEITIPAKRAVKFKVGKGLADRIR